MNSFWQSRRFIASNGGKLVVSWPLLPDSPRYERAGPSLYVQLTARRAGAFVLGHEIENDWPGWIAQGNGLSWQGLWLTWNPQLPWRNYRGIAIPWWMLTVATLPAAAVPMVGRVRRHVRRRHGLCISCGYDLRATPGRCPECGTVPHQTPETAA
jgi:hypothetical protein